MESLAPRSVPWTTSDENTLYMGLHEMWANSGNGYSGLIAAPSDVWFDHLLSCGFTCWPDSKLLGGVSGCVRWRLQGESVAHMALLRSDAAVERFCDGGVAATLFDDVFLWGREGFSPHAREVMWYRLKKRNRPSAWYSPWAHWAQL